MSRRSIAAFVAVVCLLLASMALGTSPSTAQNAQNGGPAPLSSTHRIAAGGGFGCAIIPSGDVRCWGYNIIGALGQGNTDNVGDNEHPGSVATIDLGVGRTATSLAVGSTHACAILDDGTVRCWGEGTHGRLGYGNQDHIGDDELPSSVGPVDIGTGRTAVAITAGAYHTCVILDDGDVRCWGPGGDGRLGSGSTSSIGDNETPGSVSPVNLGGANATAISAGVSSTCALLQGGSVRCWGDGGQGRLGSGNTNDIGDNESPASVSVVSLGSSAIGLASGESHTCAILGNGTVRCWGYGVYGQLGYGGNVNIGDNELPSSVGPVDLGSGRTAVAIAGGGANTCAILDDDNVRCWGYGGYGTLGYGNTSDIGDDETPASAGPVDLDGGVPVEVAVGTDLACVLLDDNNLRCWGQNANGQLGLSSTTNIGDDETPASVDTIAISPPDAPTGVTVDADTDSIQVDFIAPQYTGGGSLTYEVIVAPPGIVESSSSSPVVVSGLEGDTEYSIAVQAVNGAGESPPSSAVEITTDPLPTPAAINVAPGTSSGYTVVNGDPVAVPAFTSSPNPVTGVAPTPNGDGAWTVASDGGVFTTGTAPFLGSIGGTPLNAPVVGITPTAEGDGYWLVASDGGVFAFGEAPFVGSMGGFQLNAAATAVSPTCSGNGYYVVSEDGGVFAFGDAAFHGSLAGQPLNGPIVSIVATCDGYWLLGEDGGVFAFGDAVFFGSAADDATEPIDALIATGNRLGYWVVGRGGSYFEYGNASQFCSFSSRGFVKAQAC